MLFRSLHHRRILGTLIGTGLARSSFGDVLNEGMRWHPLLPFVHSMAAFRETIGGMYGMTYWTELGKLGIFLLLSLILGLLLRKPVIRMNEAFAEKLEETKIM